MPVTFLTSRERRVKEGKAASLGEETVVAGDKGSDGGVDWWYQARACYVAEFSYRLGLVHACAL